VNPHYNTRFADLAAIWEVCRKPLNSNGLSVIQSPEPSDSGGLVLRTTLLHMSGQFVSSAIPLAYNPASMQSLGSAITYARGYALAALVGVVTEADDDGNAADAGPASRPTSGNARSSIPPRKNVLEEPPWGRFGAPSQGKTSFRLGEGARASQRSSIHWRRTRIRGANDWLGRGGRGRRRPAS
jgi:hypothetical protein